MTLRACDAEPFLRLKRSMVESDHDAEFLDGRKLPVYIYQTAGQPKYMVELEYQFFEAKTLPGFVRLQKQPDAQPRVEEAPPVESTKITGNTWREQKANADRINRKALGDRQAANKEQQQGIVVDSPLARANYKHAQDVAARLRPQR